MSGWIKSSWPRWLAKISYKRIPTVAVDALDKIDAQWDVMSGKEPSSKQSPAMPQEKVDKEFAKKVERIHPHSHGKL